MEGNTRIEKERLLDQRVEAFRSWGKHFLVELPNRRSFFCESCQVRY